MDTKTLLVLALMLTMPFAQSPDFSGPTPSELPESLESQHLNVIELNNSSFTIEVKDIPKKPTTLACQTYMPQNWVVTIYKVERYNHQIDFESLDDDGPFVEEQVHRYNGIQSSMPILCELRTWDLESNSTVPDLTIDSIYFKIPGQRGTVQYHWQNFSITSEWDGLWSSWNYSESDMEDFAWFGAEIRYFDSGARSSYPSNGLIGERFYLGGESSGDRLITMVAVTHDGKLTQPEWYNFYSPENSKCGDKVTECSIVLDVTRYFEY